MHSVKHSGERIPGRATTLMIVTVLLVGANMRISVYSIGPLIELIAVDERVPIASLGGLVSVPLFAWGVVSAFAHTLSARFGIYRTVLVSLVCLAVGTLCRSWPGPIANIWIGTFIIGASLAIGNVLIPALIRRDFSSRVTLMVALYTGAMASVGAAGAGVMIPLAELQVGGEPLGWRFALLMTGLPVLPAVILWVVTYRSSPKRSPAGFGAVQHMPLPAPLDVGPIQRRPVWRSGLAWLIGIYMGAQSASFYIMSTWIPLISVSHGRSSVAAGADVMLFQLASIIGSFAVPLIYRGRLERWLPAALPVLMLGMMLTMVFLGELISIAAILGGVVAGVSLSVSLTLPLVRTRDLRTASALSGMAQSIGFIVAAVGPITFGALHQLTGDWLLALWLVVIIAATQLVSGIVVGDDRRYVLGKADAAPRHRQKGV